MYPSRSRPPPLRNRAPLQPALLAAPDAEAAGAQAAAPTQRQRLAAALRTDTTDIITLAQTQPGSEDWAHTWTAVHSFFFFFFFWVKKAYMPIDANHISNSKDR